MVPVRRTCLLALGWLACLFEASAQSLNLPGDSLRASIQSTPMPMRVLVVSRPIGLKWQHTLTRSGRMELVPPSSRGGSQATHYGAIVGAAAGGIIFYTLCRRDDCNTPVPIRIGAFGGAVTSRLVS